MFYSSCLYNFVFFHFRVYLNYFSLSRTLGVFCSFVLFSPETLQLIDKTRSGVQLKSFCLKCISNSVSFHSYRLRCVSVNSSYWLLVRTLAVVLLKEYFVHFYSGWQSFPRYRVNLLLLSVFSLVVLIFLHSYFIKFFKPLTLFF